MMDEDHARAYLTNKYEELQIRIGKLAHSRTRAAQALSADSEEQAIEVENDEVLDRLAETSNRELAQLRRALDHLDCGKYGICSICGQAITYARLNAMPEATECIDCVRG